MPMKNHNNNTQYVQQIVRTNAFLEEKEINLADLEQGVNVISCMQNNAVILNVDVEVSEAGTGTLDVGIAEDTNLFISDVDLTSVKNNMSSVRLSTKDKVHKIVLDVKQPQTQGKIIFRMVFFGNEIRMKDYVVYV